MKRVRLNHTIIAMLLTTSFMIMAWGCSFPEKKSMEVTATAYNSLAAQTHRDHPAITAWGDTLKPGMKAIAVSRDLIDSGLIYGTEVKIEGLKGTYTVRDKMNKRWTQKIDIYMGTSEKNALEWGKRKVTIKWSNPHPQNQ